MGQQEDLYLSSLMKECEKKKKWVSLFSVMVFYANGNIFVVMELYTVKFLKKRIIADTLFIPQIPYVSKSVLTLWVEWHEKRVAYTNELRMNMKACTYASATSN